ncbi:MAG: DUF4419 domain-containing protein, partial [Fibrella sp.]|nr:DUF4419 domain-containing protein [Armatimonadota bacterium]
MTVSTIDRPRIRTVSVRGNPVEPDVSLRPTTDYETRVKAVFGDAVEAHSRGTDALIEQYGTLHSFVDAALTAFNFHHPLVLSPDMIWLLIAQGFALHVNANAEAMRHRFVAHEGKKDILIFRDEFVKGF